MQWSVVPVSFLEFVRNGRVLLGTKVLDVPCSGSMEMKMTISMMRCNLTVVGGKYLLESEEYIWSRQAAGKVSFRFLYNHAEVNQYVCPSWE